MKNIKQKLRRAALYLLGFSAFPILTSCYGMPQDHQEEYDMGKVLNDKQEPIEGVKVTYKGVGNNRDYTLYTAKDGSFEIYESKKEGRVITFEDVDGDKNGGLFQSQYYVMDGKESNLTISMSLKK